jgi:DUF1365 family protein
VSHSAVYEGVVQHRRHSPVEHRFEYRVFLLYLDLDELPDVLSHAPLASASGPALARFKYEDHFGDANAVRDLVETREGRRPQGPIRLLTHLRYFGYVFNPVSFYYCFTPDEQLDVIVAEVDNTPWGERHLYVLSGNEDLHFRFPKAFHVSPFMGMEQIYDWQFGVPGERLRVEMRSEENGRVVFDARLALRRRELSKAALAQALLRYPAMTARVVGAIYWQALRLWRKGAPFFHHPKTEARA